MNTIESMKAIQIQIDELKESTKAIQAEIDCRPTRDEFESFCNRMGIEDANGNTCDDYKQAEKECPEGHIVVWNRFEKGYKYRKLDKDGYMINE